MSDKQQFDLSSTQSSAGAAGKQTQNASSPGVREGVPLRVWLALGVLLLLALAVVFVLPGVVERYELPLTQRNDAVPEVGPPVDTSPILNPVSPFQEAQLARQRREAQDVLSSLLERQEALDGAAVEEWAAERYAEAVEAARQGDEHYRSGQFGAAVESYREADRTLAALQDDMPRVFARLLDEGRMAMQAGEAERARQRFSLALQLDPDSEEAATGLERARTLDEVESLLARARQLQQDGRLEEAQQILDRALSLDARHEQAVALEQRNRQLIRENEFTRTMSQGFALLQSGEPDAAIEAFEQAEVLRPESDQPREAIRQARDQMTNAAIARHRSQALAHEETERWAEAAEAYRAALELDENLVFAREGLDYAERRLQLDRLVQQALDNPVRLGQQDILEYTLEVYQTARSLDQPGQRLSRQLDELQALLAEAQQPVEVELQSDNATHVTLYQVGELGSFDSMALDLRPGRYVAVGTRPGYRDVREEFVVGFGRDPGAVTIACREPVQTTGGL